MLYSYALLFSFLLVAMILPLLSGMADYAGKKKIFVYPGAFSCIGLFFFTGENIEWEIICCILTSVGPAVWSWAWGGELRQVGCN